MKNEFKDKGFTRCVSPYGYVAFIDPNGTKSARIWGTEVRKLLKATFGVSDVSTTPCTSSTEYLMKNLSKAYLICYGEGLLKILLFLNQNMRERI
jgi:hypothetical protein